MKRNDFWYIRRRNFKGIDSENLQYVLLYQHWARRKTRWAVCQESGKESLFKGGVFFSSSGSGFLWCAIFSHLTSSFHSMKNHRLYTQLTASYTQFFPHRRFSWCFSLSLFYNFCCFYFLFAAVQPAFDSVFFLFIFFRGEIIHQFLFSLHSCTNDDRKKLLSCCRLPVFKFSEFLCWFGWKIFHTKD